MYDPNFARYNRGSYPEAVAPPAASGANPRTVCVEIEVAWVPYVTGALSQLAHPATWLVANEAALYDVLGRVQDVIATIGGASECMQVGTQVVTIASGDTDGAIRVSFVPVFLSLPTVVVSESTGDLIASASAVTVAGFTLRATANVPTIVDTVTVVSWMARP